MKKHQDTRIKEVLKKYPQLATVLEEYDINCYKCNGDCLLKNIFEEHNFSMTEEMELKRKLSENIPKEVNTPSY